MYGSYGLYSGNKSNFSSSNLYKPAGVVNTTNSSYINNGVVTSNPTVSYTSVIQPVMSNINSVQQINNNSFSAQHIDYEQNPAPIKLK